jgi:hypothetical protein
MAVTSTATTMAAGTGIMVAVTGIMKAGSTAIVVGSHAYRLAHVGWRSPCLRRCPNNRGTGMCTKIRRIAICGAPALMTGFGPYSWAQDSGGFGMMKGTRFARYPFK